MNLTLEQAGRLCYETRWAHQKDGDRSFRNFESTLEDTSLAANTPVADILPTDLRRAAGELTAGGLSPATANRRIAAVRAVLDTAVDAGALVYTPRYRRLPEGGGRTRVLSTVEYSRLYEAMYGDQYKLLTQVLWETGMRVSEALNIKWCDLRIPEGEVILRDTKSGKDRRVPVRDTLFSGANGRRGPFSNLSRSSYSRAWQAARADVGMADDPEFVPHALRHSFATRLVKQGTALNVVSKLMGHGSIAMTMRYAHAADESLREAVDKLRAGDEEVTP